MLFFISFITLKLFAQTKSYKNEIGFKSDNDAFLANGQDRYYTNGLFINYRHALKADADSSKKAAKKIFELTVAQQIYNPISGFIPDASFIDRPFAGYLYAGASLQYLYKKENVLKIAIQAGTIGPNAKGEEVQKGYHDLFGFYELNGWETQVKNALALNAIVDYQHLLHRSENKKTDFSVQSQARLGTTFTGASTGILFRAGSVNPFYQSASTNSLISNQHQLKNINDKELFFFAMPQLSFIAYDATMQGGLFKDDKGPFLNDPKKLVFSQTVGVAYSKNRWTLDLAYIFKSREVKSNAKPHQYGMVNIYYRFN